MTIVLMTTNRWKIPEYRRFFARHAQALVVESPTEEPAALAAWLTSARAVLADESNIFDEPGDQVSRDHVGPARNICRLHAWLRGADGGVARKTYIREVRGHFDGRALRPGDPTVFDWDSAFRASSGPTLEAMDHVGLKNSAREQCLSAFAREHLHRAAPQKLRWTDVGEAPFSLDVTLLTEHPLYQRLPEPLARALAFAIDRGVFFRGKKSRRDGNYWFPGLNGGLPYVPKGDPIHEATYLFHDVMHHLMPDLVFDGAATRDHKRVYVAYRMMSEGVSLVLADMLFVDALASDPAHAGYDFAARRIHPLYRAIDPSRRADLRWLLQQIAGFVLRGDPGELPTDTDAWRAFDAKYTKFFVADFQWTRMNWENLVARADGAGLDRSRRRGRVRGAGRLVPGPRRRGGRARPHARRSLRAPVRRRLAEADRAGVRVRGTAGSGPRAVRWVPALAHGPSRVLRAVRAHRRAATARRRARRAHPRSARLRRRRDRRCARALR